MVRDVRTLRRVNIRGLAGQVGHGIWALRQKHGGEGSRENVVLLQGLKQGVKPQQGEILQGNQCAQ